MMIEGELAFCQFRQLSSCVGYKCGKNVWNKGAFTLIMSSIPCPETFKHMLIDTYTPTGLSQTTKGKLNTKHQHSQGYGMLLFDGIL